MADQPHLPIRIAELSFDPAGERPPRRRDPSSANERSDEPERVIVQLHEPPTREEQARLRGQYGLRLLEYVPEQAYVERLHADEVKRLAADPAVRAVMPFEPAFKVSPHIGERVYRTPERRAVQGRWLEAVLFADADAEGVARLLTDMGFSDVRILDDRAAGGAARVRFVSDPERPLDEVARLEGIRWIDE